MIEELSGKNLFLGLSPEPTVRYYSLLMAQTRNHMPVGLILVTSRWSLVLKSNVFIDDQRLKQEICAVGFNEQLLSRRRVLGQVQ